MPERIDDLRHNTDLCQEYVNAVTYILMNFYSFSEVQIKTFIGCELPLKDKLNDCYFGEGVRGEPSFVFGLINAKYCELLGIEYRPERTPLSLLQRYQPDLNQQNQSEVSQEFVSAVTYVLTRHYGFTEAQIKVFMGRELSLEDNLECCYFGEGVRGDPKFVYELIFAKYCELRNVEYEPPVPLSSLPLPGDCLCT